MNAASATPHRQVDVFFSYSHRDEPLRDELSKHLKLLERQGFVKSWHDRRIAPGDEWRSAIDENLRAADIILLLISADFLASDYCFDVEMQTALERHERGEARVVPIILRPVDWRSSPFGKLKALPKDGKPVVTFASQDSAFEEIAAEIRRLIENEPGERAPSFQRRQTAKIQLLPVTPSSPLILGLAIDVSGSMQTSMRNADDRENNRLQAVLDTLKRLSAGSAQKGGDPEVAPLLELVRVFAYGFGFTNRVSDFAPLAPLASRFFNVSIPSAPSDVYRGTVRDLLEIAGLGKQSVPLKDIGEHWSEVENRLWGQRFDLFGETPMREAVTKVRDRFVQEFCSYRGVPRSALVVISDGESTDGSPADACDDISRAGTTVIGAYLTSNDIGEARKLYSKAHPAWSTGARTLFDVSSVIGEDGAAVTFLRSKGWDVDFGSRLFLQINQSEIMSEFVSGVLSTEAVAARPA